MMKSPSTESGRKEGRRPIFNRPLSKINVTKTKSWSSWSRKSKFDQLESLQNDDGLVAALAAVILFKASRAWFSS